MLLSESQEKARQPNINDSSSIFNDVNHRLNQALLRLIYINNQMTGTDEENAPYERNTGGFDGWIGNLYAELSLMRAQTNDIVDQCRHLEYFSGYEQQSGDDAKSEQEETEDCGPVTYFSEATLYSALPAFDWQSRQMQIIGNKLENVCYALTGEEGSPSGDGDDEARKDGYFVHHLFKVAKYHQVLAAKILTLIDNIDGVLDLDSTVALGGVVKPEKGYSSAQVGEVNLKINADAAKGAGTLSKLRSESEKLHTVPVN